MERTLSDDQRPITLTKSEIAWGKRMCAHHAKTYYRASWFFPKKEREATWVLYGFVRMLDEIVDTQKNEADAFKELTDLKKQWIELYTSDVHSASNEAFEATKKVFRLYHIPFEYSISFFDAMIQDTHKKDYANYTELEQYMYGSASVVGLMMCHIIGYQEGALPYAEKLGFAMQLTNFLRDIDEDYVLRKRIYLPQDELAHFNLSSQDITEKINTENWRAFMKYQIKRADTLYEESRQGITLLSKNGRLPVYIALVLYREILRKIEKINYAIWNTRAHTSLLEKILLIIQSYIWNKTHNKK